MILPTPEVLFIRCFSVVRFGLVWSCFLKLGSVCVASHRDLPYSASLVLELKACVTAATTRLFISVDYALEILVGREGP